MRELKLKSHYDLVVVGGGIQGCAMLWEAQSRGLNTLLVEAEDYCSQTSANSLKTIHGGIRYLQTLNLSRTLRSAKEQETLLNIAPHLVHPLACLLPTEKKLKRSKLAVSTGFSFYNLLKKFACSNQKLPKARCLSKTELVEHTQLLNLQKVTGAGFWHDAQVQHAERLGLAFVKTAQAAGGDAYNYLRAQNLTTTQNQQFQFDLDCQLSQQKYRVSSDNVIYCSASKTVENLSGFEPKLDNYPNFCMAVNLVLKDRYAEAAIGLQSGFAQTNAKSSSRLLFAAPWRDSTLFGTWYFDIESGNRLNKKPNKEQVEFCLADVNRTYPKAAFSSENIVDVHAGLLPVNHNDTEPENRLVEQDFIHKPDSSLSLIIVIPTKYTTCRATAEKTIDQLVMNSDKVVNRSVSSTLPLIGGKDIDDFEKTLFKLQHQYRHLFSTATIERLAIIYGNQIGEIALLCEQKSELAELMPGSSDHIKAQLEFELEYGQVERLNDFVFGRSFLGVELPYNRLALEYCSKRINQFHSYEESSAIAIEKLLKNTLY